MSGRRAKMFGTAGARGKGIAMKKYILTAVVGLIGLTIVAGSLLGQAEEGRERGRRRREGGGDRTERRERFRRAQQEREDALIDSLELSAEKEAAVRQIFETQREEAANTRGENRELFQKMRAAREEGDEEAARKLMQEFRERREQGNENLMNQLKEVLNEEQMAKVQESRVAGRRGRGGRGRPRPEPRIFGAVQELNLTQQQRTQVKKILDNAEQQILRILTPDQRKGLKEASERLGQRRAEFPGRRRGGGRARGRGRGREAAPEGAE